MAMKEYFTLPKSIELKPHNQMKSMSYPEYTFF